MANTGLYLGRLFDPQKNNVTVQSVNYDPADLTTHAVVTGMTGSGKTGLCINLLEEAALQGIPAIIIDPKGDLTNLLLHFPELAPSDFQPWIDPEIARRAGETVEQASGAASLAWRKGLQEWGIDHERMLALKNAAEFTIYTPGSDSGIPVSVLSSLNVPELDWNANREVLRERISSTVTALLGLVGIQDVDPIQSREHILLSNLFENTWSQGKNIDLTELILQTQTPPFDKLGAFAVDTFFPPKERMSLAMQLNNILAAPAFEAWREGQSIEVSNLLYAKDGRPRHSIFYLAHLTDAERMFFVTLLFSSIETWMRTQTGTGSLRAILYMDELFGYLPPTANPPSKEPLLRMLKQGRAFGLGLLLATQNPVDVDYKALSNAGTWFIGKLQTDQDKQRLLDGLMGSSGGTPRAALDQLISRLAKRVFVLHNVHAKQPRLFQTRWTMNFLAGPLTRAQIPELNRLVGAQIRVQVPAAKDQVPGNDRSSQGFSEPVMQQPAGSSPVEESTPAVPTLLSDERTAPSDGGSQTKPSLPAGIAEYFLPQTFSLPEAFSEAKESMPPEAMLKGVIYRPALLASAQIRFLDRKLGVDSNLIRAVLVEKMARNSAIHWDDYAYKGPALEKIGSDPTPGARFGMIDTPLNDSKRMAAMQKDFTDWVYRNSSVKARINQALKVFAGPDITQADFMKACADAAREARDAELEKTTGALDRKIKSLEEKIDREERELQQDQTELSQRKNEEFGNLAELGASLVGIGRKKSLTTQLTKRRLTEQAKGNVDESIQAIDQYKKDLSELQHQRAETAQEIGDRWGKVVNDVASVDVNPKKTDIYVNLFGIAWVPHYLIQSGGQVIELPAFGME